MRPTTTVPSRPGLPAFLVCVRHRESRGDYTAVNKRSGAGGAFQFLYSTWRNVAPRAGYGQYAGTGAQHAPPAVQDAVAIWTLNHIGKSPWAGPGCR